LTSLMLNFVEEYPIYRGLRVPLWVDGKLVRVRRVSDLDKKAFKEMLEKLREILVDYSKSLDASGVSPDEKLEAIADALTIFLKAPLFIETSEVAPTPLKAYMLYLMIPNLIPKLVTEKLTELADALYTLREIQVPNYVRELASPELSEQLTRLWIALPADTRPGYNTSSLFAHTLMTAALAWVLAKNAGMQGKELQELRIAALLHDIGKPVNPQRHWEESVNIAKYLLNGIIDSTSLQKILEIIQTHHTKADLPIVQADRLAASADRLAEAVEEVLGEKLRKLEERLKSDRNSWDFWRKLYESREEFAREELFKEDPIKELTEEFLSKAKPPSRGTQTNGISLVIIDVASIQDLITRSQEIRVMAAASYLVDLAVYAHIPMLLKSKLGIPPEAILYAGGGNILLIVPTQLVESVENLTRDYQKNNPLKLVAASTIFTDNYRAASNRLSTELFKKKYSINLGGKISLTSGEKLCQMCYREFAKRKVQTPEGEKEVCDTCYDLYSLGSQTHFKAKWYSKIRILNSSFKPADVFNSDYNEVSKTLLELIAGHQPEEFARKSSGRTLLRDYAVVKIDGNSIGSFMSDSLSFSEIIEKSFRIDVSLKKAYAKALELLCNGVKDAAQKMPQLASQSSGLCEREVARVYLGTIYMGGDDGLLLLPAWAAIPFAHFMAEEFARGLGLSRGLTVAVVAGPARMSIWSLLDSASKLMDLSKQVVRRYSQQDNKALSAIVFDVYDSGSPSGAFAEERFRRSSRRYQGKVYGRITLDEGIDSSQPFLVTESVFLKREPPELWSGLGGVVMDIKPNEWTDDESIRVHTEAFTKAFLVTTDSEKKYDDAKRVAVLKSALNSAWREASGSKHWREKLVVYVSRQAKREVKAGYYEKLQKVLVDSLLSDTPSVPIADLLILLKLVRGGAW